MNTKKQPKNNKSNITKKADNKVYMQNYSI